MPKVKRVVASHEKGNKRRKSNLVITVNELLFAKANEFARSEEVSTFKSSGGAETPARAA